MSQLPRGLSLSAKGIIFGAANRRRRDVDEVEGLARRSAGAQIPDRTRCRPTPAAPAPSPAGEEGHAPPRLASPDQWDAVALTFAEPVADRFRAGRAGCVSGLGAGVGRHGRSGSGTRSMSTRSGSAFTTGRRTSGALDVRCTPGSGAKPDIAEVGDGPARDIQTALFPTIGQW